MTGNITRAETVRIAEAAIHGVMGGTLADLVAVVHPDATNREASAEPPATRGCGPRAFHATGEWLREGFSDLVWTTERSIAEDDVVVTFGTMSGRHTGNFVVWAPDETVERVFVPTGRAFTVRQAHFQRIEAGLVIEHWAVRDDQGMAMQAGWIPPSPGFLLRCALATRRARRAAQHVLDRVTGGRDVDRMAVTSPGGASTGSPAGTGPRPVLGSSS